MDSSLEDGRLPVGAGPAGFALSRCASQPKALVPDAAQGELTPEGLALFERLDGSEQAIVRWLFTLPQDWPFTGHDIAAMILGGEHRDSDRSGEAVETTGSTEGESAGREASPVSSRLSDTEGR